MREATVARKTNETEIEAASNLDGTGQYEVATGIGFLDHMLEQLARHGLMDLDARAKGDLHIDFHHTTEDTGIVIGQAVAKALGDRRGIRRYGDALIPMDETLTRVAHRRLEPALSDLEGRVPAPEGRRDGHRAVQGVVPGLRPGRRRDPACREPVRREQPSHRRILLQGPGPSAAPAVEIDPRKHERDAIDQGHARARAERATLAPTKSMRVHQSIFDVDPLFTPDRRRFVQRGIQLGRVLFRPVWALGSACGLPPSSCSRRAALAPTWPDRSRSALHAGRDGGDTGSASRPRMWPLGLHLRGYGRRRCGGEGCRRRRARSRRCPHGRPARRRGRHRAS